MGRGKEENHCPYSEKDRQNLMNVYLIWHPELFGCLTGNMEKSSLRLEDEEESQNINLCETDSIILSAYEITSLTTSGVL